MLLFYGLHGEDEVVPLNFDRKVNETEDKGKMNSKHFATSLLKKYI